MAEDTLKLEEDLYYERMWKNMEVPYSTLEQKYLRQLYRKMTKSNNQRSQTFMELDDMDYLTYYDRNFKTDIAYTRMRKNPEERLIVGGTTKQKTKSLLSALLNYNLESSITSFDQSDHILNEVGETMADLVKKSRELEDYDLKRPLYYKEAIAQGTWYVEELWYENWVPRKTITEHGDPKKLSSIQWTEEKVLEKALCTTRLIPGKKVFLGDIYQAFFDKQPFVFTVDRLDYEECESMFHEWERWGYVGKKIRKFFNYATVENKEDQDGVEMVKFYDPWRKEFQLLLNGVMMLKTGYPLELVSPSGGIPLVQGQGELMKQDFAISRSVPADTKFDNEIIDDFIRTIVLKAQQGYMPPQVNNTNRVLDRSIFLPGKITRNLNPDLIKSLIPNPGVSASDLAAFEFVKRIVDEKSVSPGFTGDTSNKNITATEVMELKKQQLMKLGLLVVGIINFEKELTKLRIATILAHWTTPIDKKIDLVKKTIEDVYRTVTVASTDENGREVNRVVRFDERGANTKKKEQVEAEEDILSYGEETPVRISYLNPKLLSTLKANWVVNITPTEKDTSELRRLMFMESITQGFGLFGPQAFNIPYLQQRWAIMNKEDPEKLFVKAPVAPAMMGAEVAGGGMMGKVGNEMMRGAGAPPVGNLQPSVNTLMAQ